MAGYGYRSSTGNKSGGPKAKNPFKSKKMPKNQKNEVKAKHK